MFTYSVYRDHGMYLDLLKLFKFAVHLFSINHAIMESRVYGLIYFRLDLIAEHAFIIYALKVYLCQTISSYETKTPSWTICVNASF